MTGRTAVHDTFSIKRTYQATPRQAFAAFADPRAKASWTDSPEATAVGDSSGEYLEFDFRVGGHERFEFKMPDGRVYSYDAVYYDIVPDQRIVYCYQMDADGARDSVSVVTVEFTAQEAGTALAYTEQGVYLDGVDRPELREEGMTELLGNLSGYLAAQGA
jgi:uncharacterized protein YndB with AHSA1/START domain